MLVSWPHVRRLTRKEFEAQEKVRVGLIDGIHLDAMRTVGPVPGKNGTSGVKGSQAKWRGASTEGCGKALRRKVEASCGVHVGMIAFREDVNLRLQHGDLGALRLLDDLQGKPGGGAGGVCSATLIRGFAHDREKQAMGGRERWEPRSFEWERDRRHVGDICRQQGLC